MQKRLHNASVLRAEESEPKISGYFIVFETPYKYDSRTAEYIAASVGEDISGDVRALVNHDTSLVLGRTDAGTLRLKADNTGIWGDIDINPEDSDAMNLYTRVKRGDVTQCSFGFDILAWESRDDGYAITKIKLWEVSVCTFPAYEATKVFARDASQAKPEPEDPAYIIRLENIKKKIVEAKNDA